MIRAWLARGGSRLAADDGSVLPLVAGTAALGLTVILVVVAVTSLYLDHKRLLSVADAAALVGAEAFRLDDVTVIGERVEARLDSEHVRQIVRSYVQEVAQASAVDDIALVSAAADDGRGATVVLSGRWSPPLLSPFVPDGLPLEVRSTARSVFG